MEIYLPSEIVDWVLIEIRDADEPLHATTQTILDRRAAFLLPNGSVVPVDGLPYLQFNRTINHQLYVVVLHRNHLGIMSSGPLMKTNGVYQWDFRSGHEKVYLGELGYNELQAGVWGMVSGDGNANGNIENGDKVDVWIPQSGHSGYYSGDFNLDIQVNTQDKMDLWTPNSGKASQMPQ